MQKTLFLIILVTMVFISCKKNADDNLQEPIPEGTVLKTGTLVSNSKTTSGTVKIVQGTGGGQKLLFEKLSTGSGPDVRVWLSPNTTGSPYVELGPLKSTTGSFSYDLNAGTDFTTNNRVLIWCEDFSVLFGHAVLQ